MKPNKEKSSRFVSAVIRRHGVLRYLWPFWSRQQLIRFVGGIVITSMLWSVFLDIPLGLDGAIIGMVVGGLCGCANTTMPAQLIITTRREASGFLPEVEMLLLRQGYERSDDPEPGCLHYRKKWLHWGERGMTVRMERHQITLDGPIGVLWRTHHIITKH
jgi:hypothetical protein